MRTSLWIGLLAVGTTATLIAACGEDRRPTLTLEQAKTISAQFEGQGFKPPPRTIADITAILEKQQPDPTKRAAAVAAADRQRPPAAQGADLARFFFERALAAQEVGRTQQQVDDAVRAMQIIEADGFAPVGTRSRYIGEAARAYGNAGKRAESFELQERRLKLHEGSEQGRGAMFNILRNQAESLARFGRTEDAQAYLKRLDQLLSESVAWRGVTALSRADFQTQVLSAKRTYLLQVGRYAEAETTARELVALFVDRLIPGEAEATRLNQLPPGTYANTRDFALADLARILMAQGRLVEAEVEARRTLNSRLERFGRYAPQTASDVLLLAGIILQQGRYTEAQKLAEASVEIYENLGLEKSAWPLLNARRFVARALSSQNKLEEAFAVYQVIERDIGTDPDTRRALLDQNPNYANLLPRERSADAIRILEAAASAARDKFGERHYETARTRGMLGAKLAQLGQYEKALTELDASLPIILSPSRQVADEEDEGGGQRDRDHQRIVESYLGAVAETKRQGLDAETFRVADAVRGQSVQRALAASSARAAAADPALAELVRREQDAQKQAAAFQGMLTLTLSNPDLSQDGQAAIRLRTNIDQLRTARAAIREEIERQFPDYVNLIDPRPATVELVQRHLKPGEALISTYVGRDRLFVWAVPASGPVAYAATTIPRGQIESMVAKLRTALDPYAPTLGDLPAFDVALAARLYQMVLKPVEAGWKDAKQIFVIQHGGLAQVPFSLLVTEPTATATPADGAPLFSEYKTVPFLARRVGVTQLPSVNALATLRTLPPAPETRQAFLGFGDPWFSVEQATEAKAEATAAGLQTRGARRTGALATRGVPLVRRNAPATQTVDSAELGNLPRLPDTADEVRGIALALKADPAKDVITGAQANERTVKTMNLADRKVIVIATHGLVPGDLNGLTQPALALSAPQVADIDGDGLLTMDEILALKINADWVVLSACNTATGEGAGAEAVSGLGRAFFYAGTRALLVSNWPVETTSARTLTTDIFRRQAENPTMARAEAVRQAMMALIDGPGYAENGATVFTYAHPIFWAPFTIVGDGGGGRAGT